jgi:hypothetical protein
MQIKADRFAAMIHGWLDKVSKKAAARAYRVSSPDLPGTFPILAVVTPN